MQSKAEHLRELAAEEAEAANDPVPGGSLSSFHHSVNRNFKRHRSYHFNFQEKNMLKSTKIEGLLGHCKTPWALEAAKLTDCITVMHPSLHYGVSRIYGVALHFAFLPTSQIYRVVI